MLELQVTPLLPSGLVTTSFPCSWCPLSSLIVLNLFSYAALLSEVSAEVEAVGLSGALRKSCVLDRLPHHSNYARRRNDRSAALSDPQCGDDWANSNQVVSGLWAKWFDQQYPSKYTISGEACVRHNSSLSNFLHTRSWVHYVAYSNVVYSSNTLKTSVPCTDYYGFFRDHCKNAC